jgi:nucleoside-diphosphate-sugar epimerase
VEWIQGDILDVIGLEEAMEGVDAVIHCAAAVSFVKDKRRYMFRTNIEGTANVVNAALSQNVGRFIHVSSVAALGRTGGGSTVDEGRQWQVADLDTNYAISKYQGEMEVWRAIGEGLPAAIVNPSTILGYGNWEQSSCALFKSVYEGFPWYTNGVNGFVDVEDVAKAILLLMESNVSGERFVLSGDNWSFRELFNRIADGFGKPHPNREATPALAALAWRLESVKSFFSRKPSLLTRESARIAQSKTYFDNSKILRLLPDFHFTPLQQTIEQACRKYLQA